MQAIGAALLGVGGYVTWRTLQIGQRNLRATQEKLDIDLEGQITSRYTQAVGQLGAELKEGQPDLQVRLGGIYGLEGIAVASAAHRPAVVALLSAYVRHNAQLAHQTDLRFQAGASQMSSKC